MGCVGAAWNDRLRHAPPEPRRWWEAPAPLSPAIRHQLASNGSPLEITVGLPRAGPWSVVVSSDAFDVAVAGVGQDAELDRDDDEGLGLDEIVSGDAIAPGPLRLRVRPAGGRGGGAFTVQLHAGRVPLLGWWTLQGERGRLAHWTAPPRLNLVDPAKLARRVAALARDAAVCGEGDEMAAAGRMLAALPSDAASDATAAVRSAIAAAGDGVDAALVPLDRFLGSAGNAGESSRTRLRRGAANAYATIERGSAARNAGRCDTAEREFEIAAGDVVTLERALDLELRRCDLDWLVGRFARADARLRNVIEGVASLADGPTRAAFAVDAAQKLLELGRVEEAQALLDSARAAASDAGASSHGAALLVAGLIAEERGDAATAAADYGAALEVFARAAMVPGGADHLLERSAARLNRGRTLRKQGRFDAAGREREFEALLSELSEAARDGGADEDHPDLVAAAQDGLALVRRHEGRLLEAAGLAKQAGDAFRAAGRVEYLLDSTLVTVARIALDRGELTEAAAVLAEAERLLAAVGDMDRTARAHLRSRFAEWSRVAQDECAANAEAHPGRAGEFAERALLAAETWRGRLLRSEATERDDGAGRSRLSHLRRWLGDDSVLLEFVVGERELRVVVVTASSCVVHTLGAREELAEKAAAFSRSVLGSAAAAPEVFAEQGRAFHRALLEPALAALPDAVRRLIVSPCEGLHDLPFDALVLPGPDRPERYADLEFVIDRFDVVLAPSCFAAAAGADRHPAPPAAAPLRGLFLADARFADEEESGSAADGRARLRRIVWTRDEAVAAMRSLLPESAAAQSAGELGAALLERDRRRDQRLRVGGCELRLGSEANVDALLAIDRGEFDVLHCATHAHAELTDPQGSALWLSAGRDGRRSVDRNAIRAVGFDGVLVVLSACASAAGRELAGEGVLSLAHAFLEGGAGAVIATRTAVVDAAAAEFVKRFYASLAASRRIDESTGFRIDSALSEAKRSFRGPPGERGAVAGALEPSADALVGHPGEWARFVCVGAP
jgi:tetratricopeptide (TPR) repeat protein